MFWRRATLYFFLLSFLVLGIYKLPSLVVHADEVQDLQNQIDDLNKTLSAIRSANDTNKKQLSDLQAQMASLQAKINTAKKQADALSKSIKEREATLGVTFDRFNERVAASYVNRQPDWSLLLLARNSNLGEFFRDFEYRQRVRLKDQQEIQSLAAQITQFEKDKLALEASRSRLEALQASLDTNAKFLASEVEKANKAQSEISGKIASLTAAQQSIINARSGTVTTSVGDVPLADDPNASIGYKSQAPGNSFAVFSFGAYTHRKGMSQYGAKKQAETGKSYRDIINWYYGKGVRKDDGMPDTIQVQGYGTMNFQTYLYGIAEMPSDWHIDALKAQAIAARSYAQRAGKPICTTEACQVFRKSKSDNPPAAWKQAVDETNKEIIDGDVSAQYSSTAGGFITTSGWDTTDRSGSGSWTSRAWESQALSPWFYKSWYRSGYLSSGANCGRSHPWLSQEEFADIVNAWIVRKNPNGADVGRIVPVTINECNIGGKGGSPYSLGELRDKANNSGGAVTSVSSVTVSNNNNALTTNVSLQTNRGTIDIPGSEFKETFNIRAPGYLRIPQSGFSFFQIEHKQ